MRDQRRRCRIADSHITKTDDIAAARGNIIRSNCAVRDRALTFLFTHCCAIEITVRAVRYLGIEQVWPCAEIVSHPGVGDHQFSPSLACQHVDRYSAGEEVFHHLPSNLLRIGGHAAGLGGAMVAGADEDMG